MNLKNYYLNKNETVSTRQSRRDSLVTIMNQFNLQLGSKHTPTLFAIPQSDQYQTISGLISKPHAKTSEDKLWNNKLLFTDTKTNISFQQQPKVINQKINPDWIMRDYSSRLIKEYSYLLKSNKFINGQDLRIKKIIDELKIVPIKDMSLLKIINSLYIYTLNNLTYGQPIDGLYSYDQALTNKVTDCGGFSTLLLSLLQSVNIPARLVVGFFIKDKNIFQKILKTLNFELLTFNFLSMHVWVEVLLPDKTWFPLDPAIEWRKSRGLTKRQGGFGIIPADRLVLSYGQDFKIPIKGNVISVDILQKPITI